MRVDAAVLTFNVYRTDRLPFFEATVASIRAAGIEPLVVTNGSSDQTDLLVRRQPRHLVDNGNSAAWYGMELAMRGVLETQPDIVVFSADDITYEPYWCERLIDFWQHAPADVKLATLFLEGVWQWNTVTEAIDCGGERALIRNSVPGASWSFRASDVDLILPLPQIQPGEDLAVCERLRGQGYRLAALDLAAHEGARNSAWGNMSWTYEQPLDRKKWGV